jgi:predicted Zn-dependent protease
MVADDLLEGNMTKLIGDGDARFELAMELYRQDRISEAEQLLWKLREENPTNAAVAGVLGTILWTEHKFKEALPLYQWLVMRSPHSEKASVGYFHTLWGLGRYDDAFDEARRYLKSYTSDEYALLMQEIQEAGDPRE